MLTVNGAAFSAELKIIETAVLSEIPNIAKNVSREALRRAQDGLERSVYGTVPGRVYVRTGTLRRSVTVRILPRVNSISLELYARARHFKVHQPSLWTLPQHFLRSGTEKSTRANLFLLMSGH